MLRLDFQREDGQTTDSVSARLTRAWNCGALAVVRQAHRDGLLAPKSR